MCEGVLFLKFMAFYSSLRQTMQMLIKQYSYTYSKILVAKLFKLLFAWENGIINLTSDLIGDDWTVLYVQCTHTCEAFLSSIDGVVVSVSL